MHARSIVGPAGRRVTASAGDRGGAWARSARPMATLVVATVVQALVVLAVVAALLGLGFDGAPTLGPDGSSVAPSVPPLAESDGR